MVNIDVVCSVDGAVHVDSKAKQVRLLVIIEYWSSNFLVYSFIMFSLLARLQASLRIDRLLFEECYDWAVSFDVLRLDTLHLTVTLSLLPPSELLPDMKAQTVVAPPTSMSTALLAGTATIATPTVEPETDLAELVASAQPIYAPIVTTAPYAVQVTESLLALKYSPSQFLWQWNGFPAAFFVDARTVSEISLPDLLHGLSSSSFAQSICKRYGNDNFFQLGLSGLSWFGDQVCFVIIGSQTSPNMVRENPRRTNRESHHRRPFGTARRVLPSHHVTPPCTTVGYSARGPCVVRHRSGCGASGDWRLAGSSHWWCDCRPNSIRFVCAIVPPTTTASVRAYRYSRVVVPFDLNRYRSQATLV